MSTMLDHVHETHEAIASVEETPPHPPRTETPEYARAHHFLVHEKKAPCEVCGVSVDTLGSGDAAHNPFSATAIETHHYPIERSLMDACDPRKVHDDFPQVYDQATLAAFVDSPANLKVLCDVHHRSVAHGIHHLLPQDFAVQKYLYQGYQIAAAPADADKAEATDEAILRAQGIASASNSGAVPSVGPQAASATSGLAPLPEAKPMRTPGSPTPRRRRRRRSPQPEAAA